MQLAIGQQPQMMLDHIDRFDQIVDQIPIRHHQDENPDNQCRQQQFLIEVGVTFCRVDTIVRLCSRRVFFRYRAELNAQWRILVAKNLAEILHPAITGSRQHRRDSTIQQVAPGRDHRFDQLIADADVTAVLKLLQHIAADAQRRR